MPHPADSRKLPVTGGPGTGADIVRVRDVAVIPWITDETTVEEFEAHPRADGVDLGHGLSIAVLTDEEADLVMNASFPRGHFFIPKRTFGQRYTFVKDVPLDDDFHQNQFGWDRDQKLSFALALSRLVRDNAHCAEYAGRVIEFEDGEQQVVPLHGYEYRMAYRVKQDRGWLDADEATELKGLLAAFLATDPDWPPRVRRAIRVCESASQAPLLQELQPRLVTGLESLLTTSNSNLTKQFRERAHALAQELEVEGVSKRLLDRMYTARSQAYHGDSVRLFSGDPDAPLPEIAAAQARGIHETALLQQLLRSAVRRAIEDEGVRDTFADDARIRSQWPVTVRSWWRKRQI